MAPVEADIFARSAYTIEVFGVPAELDRAVARLLVAVDADRTICVSSVPGGVGHA